MHQQVEKEHECISPVRQRQMRHGSTHCTVQMDVKGGQIGRKCESLYMNAHTIFRFVTPTVYGQYGAIGNQSAEEQRGTIGKRTYAS